MEYKDCLQQVQKYLEHSPLIILGSGASIDYGLPSMNMLSEEIKKQGGKFEPKEFSVLCKNIDSMNLEEAIDKTPLSDTSIDVLRRIIWKYINDLDLTFFKKLSQDKSNFALVDLLKIIIQSASNTATVVTTNYDRLVEYAADLIEASIITGFEGNLIRKMEFPNPILQRRRVMSRERVVNILKVHGSLDWFSKDDGSIVSFPLSIEIPPNHNPLIIPPCKGKYSLTHAEPYRDVIAQADLAFSKAGSFLCIGYGFNDDHIQPKLIGQIKSGKPVVVLCQKSTEACKQNVVSADVKKYVIMEFSSNGKTLVSGNDYNEIYDGEFWKLPDFIKTIWG